MTTDMVRKQFYLSRKQAALLKRLAERRGMSEGEVIRGALERALEEQGSEATLTREEAMKKIEEFSRQRAALGVTGEPYKWNRQEIYDERESRMAPSLKA